MPTVSQQPSDTNSSPETQISRRWLAWVGDLDRREALAVAKARKEEKWGIAEFEARS